MSDAWRIQYLCMLCTICDFFSNHDIFVQSVRGVYHIVETASQRRAVSAARFHKNFFSQRSEPYEVNMKVRSKRLRVAGNERAEKHLVLQPF